MIVPLIEDSFERLQQYPSVVQRYYTPFYYASEGNNYQCVLVHSNRICLVTLAPTHPVVKHKKQISKLDFQVSNKLDRLDNKVTGKGKKGAQYIHPQSPLCFIECADGSKYTVSGCIKGKLIEINESLLTNPQLLVEKPTSDGFIAIILPSMKDIETQKETLLNSEDYEKIAHVQNE